MRYIVLLYYAGYDVLTGLAPSNMDKQNLHVGISNACESLL